MAAKKPPAEVRPTDLTLHSYKVGFGDCFLLTFHYPNFDRNLLIDFGTMRVPEGKNESAHMLAIAKRIKEDCSGKLHAVVATHRHKDHISGFALNNTQGDSLIGELNPDLVIQPWTEDPKAQKDATHPTSKSGNKRVHARRQHLCSLRDMNRFADHVEQTSKHLRGRHLEATRSQLQLLGKDNGVPNPIAVGNLEKMGKRHRYVYSKSKSGLERLLPGVTTHVLGPPTLDQTDSIRQQRRSDKNQFWYLADERAKFWAKQGRIAQSGAGDSSTLFPDYIATRKPWDMRWYRYQAQREQADNLLSIVRVLDKAMNNTSVILLFETANKSLLFPGDAQYENWMYALSDPDAVARLKKVDLYKVGHHGSLNATPKDLWHGFTSRGGKLKAGRLTTVLSTLDHVHGTETAETEVPRSTLVKALDKESTLQDTRNISDNELSSITRLKL